MSDKLRVVPITQAKFAELSAAGKYKEGKPLPMKDGDTYWLEVLPTSAKAGEPNA